MSARRDEFQARIARQLEELHARIAELEALRPHVPEQHAISYETVVSEARRRHEATLRRLRELDEQGESWVAHDATIRGAVDDVHAAVEKAHAKRPR